MPAYVDAVARLALPLFPSCARINASHYAGSLQRLAACGLLRGDTMAAAEVLNLAQGFSATYNEGDTTRLAGLFSARPHLRWDGAHEVGDPAASWAARAAPVSGITRLTIASIQGMSPGRVRLSGHLSRTVDTRGGTSTGIETARVEQLWRRDLDGVFRVTAARIGAWVPSRPTG